MTLPPNSRDATAPWAEADSPRPRLQRARRIVEQVVVVLLLAVLAVVGATTYPIVASLLKARRPSPARRGLERALRERGWAVGDPTARPPSRYAPSPPFHGVPGMERLDDRPLPDPSAAPFGAPGFGVGNRVDDGLDNLVGRVAAVRRPTALKESASLDAPNTFFVEPAIPLLVVRDEGDWLLVGVRSTGRTVTGWVSRESIAILH